MGNVTSVRSIRYTWIPILLILLIPFTGMAQKKTRSARSAATATKETVSGTLVAKASASSGIGDIILENYSGAQIKAIQFRVLATSKTQVEAVLPGNDISDGKQWSVHHTVFPGRANASGMRTDTVQVVIFGNGTIFLPSGTSIKLLALHFQKPAVPGGTADSAYIQVRDVIGSLLPPEAAKIKTKSNASIKLW